MNVEIVSTGTELLLGQIVNTNAAYLSEKLNSLGFNVLYQSTVGDNKERMLEVLNIALNRADIVVTTGGLGPTLGDITKEVAASLLNREMKLHEPSLEKIKSFFVRRRVKMSDNNIRQAMIPEGGIVLDNNCGTAPGVVIELEGGKVVVHLPGPPRELKAMFEESLTPYLKKRFDCQGVIVSKVLRAFGLGESLLEERIREHILNQTNPTIALLARSGEIHIRLTAKASSEEEAQHLIGKVENELRPLLEEYIFATNEQRLEDVVGELLTAKKMTLSLAESCTGGLVTNMITDVSGSSRYLKGTAVCYDNSIKTKIAHVPEETLAVHGAVSKETAVCLAEGIKEVFSTDIGIGITGIAGPGGGTPEKPVGLVYIAVAGKDGTECYEHQFTGLRADNKLRAALTALNHLRRYLLNNR
jgi:nicotinamide-nucleotide amidase